ncbi:hypothetical protein EJ05DRAFT_103161 [Pseudovirgaria hyperparasitica]|uniref:Uncharacterized protein n=1 Tax=Pseudovirgaria hyperparasitica TaxID=470096 RepID=A0A6A6W0N3_9PEZI|nr:uncharacterized protein EJ05DRAFT_103161 [Pseudovirgaria hyperparasitica]KAF2755490.1 hypothetical protein EJ05DRAFT_103161 [Pseudovirgaria hyperparasitica]
MYAEITFPTPRKPTQSKERYEENLAECCSFVEYPRLSSREPCFYLPPLPSSRSMSIRTKLHKHTNHPTRHTSPLSLRRYRFDITLLDWDIIKIDRLGMEISLHFAHSHFPLHSPVSIWASLSMYQSIHACIYSHVHIQTAQLCVAPAYKGKERERKSKE